MIDGAVFCWSDSVVALERVHDLNFQSLRLPSAWLVTLQCSDLASTNTTVSPPPPGRMRTDVARTYGYEVGNPSYCVTSFNKMS